MNRFALDTSQLELLLAFEKTSSMTELASLMARDPSVISRQLKRLEEAAKVIEKDRGRWVITPLGLKVASSTRQYLKSLSEILSPQTPVIIPRQTALILINTQQAMIDAKLGTPSNAHAESNISSILESWRSKKQPIIHVHHESTNSESNLHPQSSGYQPIEELKPQGDEPTFYKQRSSALSSDDFGTFLSENEISNLLLVGFTAADCIAATAMESISQGYGCFVVHDGTATFPITGPNGKTFPASEVHELTMASLKLGDSKILQTNEVLGQSLQ